MLPKSVFGVLAMVGMALSEAQTFGFGATVRELLEKVRRVLAAAGWNVDHVLSELDRRQEAAVNANEAQEAAKRDQKAKTEAFVRAKRDLYLAASGYLDMAISAVGKGSQEAKNLRRYRSGIRRPNDADAVPLPVQPPSK